MARSCTTRASLPAGTTLFSMRHATTQAWQAVHLSRSMARPQRTMSATPRRRDADAGHRERGKAAEEVVLVRQDLVRVLPAALRPTPVVHVTQLQRDTND